MNKKLKRVRGRRAILGGVAQGFSDYFNIDVNIIRISLVALMMGPLFFAVVVLYFLGWVLLPVNDERKYLVEKTQ